MLNTPYSVLLLGYTKKRESFVSLSSSVINATSLVGSSGRLNPSVSSTNTVISSFLSCTICTKTPLLDSGSKGSEITTADASRYPSLEATISPRLQKGSFALRRACVPESTRFPTLGLLVTPSSQKYSSPHENMSDTLSKYTRSSTESSSASNITSV